MSLDGYKNYATLHVVIEKNNKKIKENIRRELEHFGIEHVTIEIELKDEVCSDSNCKINNSIVKFHHHHH